jgi:hypothetical protein
MNPDPKILVPSSFTQPAVSLKIIIPPSIKRPPASALGRLSHQFFCH